MSIRANGHHRGRRIEKTLHERRSQIYAPPCNSRRKVLSLRREIINTAPASCPLSRGERPSPVAGGISEMGQVTSFGSRSVNGGNGAEATDQDFVVCVRFPVCGDQKQTVGFRPTPVVPNQRLERPLMAPKRPASNAGRCLLAERRTDLLHAPA